MIASKPNTWLVLAASRVFRPFFKPFRHLTHVFIAQAAINSIAYFLIQNPII
jgi:hypothetical protein